jgi:hypothetical protein
MSLSLGDMYQAATHFVPHGIAGYHVDPKYEDPQARIIDKRIQAGQYKVPKPTRRGSYIDDAINQKKQQPGPCTYNLDPEKKAKARSQGKVKHKVTIFEEAQRLALKEKVPGPGEYPLDPKPKPRPKRVQSFS